MNLDRWIKKIKEKSSLNVEYINTVNMLYIIIKKYFYVV